jgi:hypothetical protein
MDKQGNLTAHGETPTMADEAVLADYPEWK